MSTPLKDSVPMAALSPLIQEWMDESPFDDRSGFGNQFGRTTEMLAAEAGLPAGRINRIMAGFQKVANGGYSNCVTFRTADKLVCAMDKVERWQTDLAPYYGPISVQSYEYEFEMPETESPCGEIESYDEGCRCRPCRNAYQRKNVAAAKCL